MGCQRRLQYRRAESPSPGARHDSPPQVGRHAPPPFLDEQLLTLDLDEDHVEEYQEIDRNLTEWMKEKAREEAEELYISLAEALRLVYFKLENAAGVMRMTALRQAVARGKIKGLKNWIHDFMSGDLEYIPETGPDK